MAGDSLTAFHEAGHATVSYLLGEMPEEVAIRAEMLPGGESLGHTRYLSVESRAIAEAAVLGNSKQDRERVMRFLLATTAGPIAQSRFMRGPGASFFDQVGWEIFGGADDHAKVSRVLDLAKRLLYADLDDIVSEADNLLAQPNIWSAVEQVAGDLLRYEQLDFEGVRGAILYNDLIGVRPLVTAKGTTRQDELRRGDWSESAFRTGPRVLSREEAATKIAAKSPLGASRIAWTEREMERR